MINFLNDKDVVQFIMLIVTAVLFIILTKDIDGYIWNKFILPLLVFVGIDAISFLLKQTKIIKR